MTHHNCITLSPKLQPFMPHFDFTATFPLAQIFRIPCYQHHTSQLPVTPPSYISLSSHFNPTPLTRNAPRNASSYARNNTTFHNNKIRESSVTLTSSTSLPGHFNSFSAVVTLPGTPLKIPPATLLLALISPIQSGCHISDLETWS
jgi:hypothetical protein